jgi:uncharacterized protein YfaP (DUF2135 family)
MVGSGPLEDGMGTVEILSPRDGAKVSSPLAVVKVRYTGAHAKHASIKVNDVVHVVQIDGSSGEIRENVTLVVGKNHIVAKVGNVEETATVTLPKSHGITLSTPDGKEVATRATPFSGSFAGANCPAGVISVNGFLQQFAVSGADGNFNEAVVLRHGANHLAIQVGELYATRVIDGTFAAAKILATLVWDTNTTDLDLYVKEPSETSVWYGHKQEKGTLDVDRTSGFGPENYSISAEQAKKGDYGVRVHYFGDRGIGRSEWTIRVIVDEGEEKQARRTFYGILDRSLGHQGPGNTGADWNDVCTVRVGARGAIAILAPGEE